MDDQKIPIVINKEPSFTEVWFEGYVEYNGEKHSFWLVDPRGKDPRGYEYECEVKWFFKKVPREIRGMQHLIIEAYKQKGGTNE